MNTHPANRRQALRLLTGSTLAIAGVPLRAQTTTTSTTVEVWKDASCGCCGDWITHMEQNGFKVTAHNSGNNAVRARLGLPIKYGSCHTALVGGYVIEGHVPASDVQRLLREKPQALGLAVPGMPIGSPGMDGAPYGGRRDRYDTLLVSRDGSSRMFQSHA